MDLHLTWDGLTGPQINYVIEYRIAGTAGSWVTAASGIHVNYYDIINIPDNYYDIKVSHYCNNSIVDVTLLSAGQSPCPIPKFSGYTIIEDNAIEQKIQVSFTNAGPNIKAKVTRLNDNVIIKQESTTSNGTYIVLMPKGVGVHNTYSIEIANDCLNEDSVFTSMGQYTVQTILQGVDVSFVDSCNCDANSPILTFNRLDASGTYINPIGVPRGLYLINIAIPAGTCKLSKGLTMLLEVMQGSELVRSLTQTLPQVDNVYTFPYSSINLKDGLYTGQFVTDIKLTLTCN